MVASLLKPFRMKGLLPLNQRSKKCNKETNDKEIKLWHL